MQIAHISTASSRPAPNQQPHISAGLAGAAIQSSAEQIEGGYMIACIRQG